MIYFPQKERKPSTWFTFHGTGGFSPGPATMVGGVCGPLNLPWEASSSVSPRFSSQIEEEHLFLLGLTPSHEGPGFWVEERDRKSVV